VHTLKSIVPRMTILDRLRDLPVGRAATAAVLMVLLGFAVSVDFPRASLGFKGDEATYYSLTRSLARDFDFTYQRQDLVRVWEEFPGPEGIFLKRGSRVDFERSSSFPFVRMIRTEDPARGRLYFAKSYIYPLFAAPFVLVFGTNGFLIFHALLLTVCYGAAYKFIAARGARPALAAAFAAVFLFASVVPIYFVWLMPELFNFTTVLCAYFLWSYKLVAAPGEGTSKFERFLHSPRSDYAAAVLLGIATFSKVTHIVLILPILLLALIRRRYASVFALGATFALVFAALLTLNAFTTGEFNFQGGNRKSFYSRTGFPFANDWETFDNRGQTLATDALPFDILLHRDTATVLLWNLWFFVAGRYSGLLPYFFPGLVAAGLFLAFRRDRQLWQWLTGGGLAAGAVGLLCYMPYTYSGGGGPIGNRYFLSFYPLFLFLLPPLRSAAPIIAGLAVGALFTAKLVFNPFYTSFNPGEHAKAGPLRMLPIELTLLNDLPVSADVDRARRTLAGTPPISAYFVDNGAYPPEGEAFWVRGGARADLILRAPIKGGPDEPVTSMRVRAWTVEVSNNGKVANRVVVSTRAGSQTLRLAAGEERVVEVNAGVGVPYKPARYPTNYVYAMSISTDNGFVPFLEDQKNTDSRYLGAMIRLVPIYFNP
jgi:hypothetical protein